MKVETWLLCLVIQIKRWTISGIRGRYQKDSRLIGFEDAMVQATTHYSLKAVICHVGGVSGGHYTCFVRPHEQWFFADDEVVRPCAWSDVLKGGAYIWFYDS